MTLLLIAFIMKKYITTQFALDVSMYVAYRCSAQRIFHGRLRKVSLITSTVSCMVDPIIPISKIFWREIKFGIKIVLTTSKGY